MRAALIALLVLYAASAEAASRYWVGGGASTNWDATGNTNWAATSGGAGNQTVPGSGDDVFCDGNSGAGTSTLNTTFTIKSFDFTGCTLSLIANAALTVAGSGVTAKFSAGMTYSGSSRSITFTGTSGTNLFTTAGQNLSLLVQNGTGGTTQQQDDLVSINATLTMDAGTWDTGTDRLVSVATLTTGGARTGTIKLNASTVLLGATAGFTATAANLTIVAGTSHITLTSATATGKTITWTGQTLYDVEITGAGTGIWTTVGGVTLHSLTLSRTNAKSLTIAPGTTITIGGTWASTVNYVKLRSGTPSSTYTISAAATNLRFIDVQDCIGAGAATPFADPGGLNSGNNMNWAFTTHHTSLLE